MAIGVIVLWRRKTAGPARIFAICSVLSAAILVMIPFVSVEYDLNRLFQELLVLMSPVMVVGGAAIWRWKWRYKPLAVGVCIVVYFGLLSRAFFQLSGGSDISMTFNDSGSDYQHYYVTDTDMAAAQWLSKQWEDDHGKKLVYADEIATTRLKLDAPLALTTNAQLDLLPSTFVKGSFLFLDSVNTATSETVRVYAGQTLVLSIDTKYFNSHLNRVFSTSDTAVYTGR
jgi:uncharacterized membrane protein